MWTFRTIHPPHRHRPRGGWEWSVWRFPNFRRYCRPFPTPRAEFQKLRWLGFPLTLHCFALFNHNQVSLFCSVQSGLRPIYATQSHPQILTLTHIKSLSSAKLRSGNAPAPKASGWPRAKPEPRSGRKGTRGSPNARSCLDNRQRSFHLTQNGNRHFTLCFQGCGHFHA